MKKRVFDILNVSKIRKNHLKITKSINPAFTIVELLVTVVVIGILAIISLVSYSGITQKANAAAITADLNSASKQFKMFNVINNAYPTSISDCPTPAAGNLCLKSSDGTSYQYTPTLSNRAFCLTATKSGSSYNLTQEGQTLAGPCPVLNLDAGNTLSYPGTGTSWYDLSGSGNTGTLTNGAVYQTANGGVISFDGTDDWADAGNDSSLNITNQITISLWVKWSSASTKEMFVKSDNSNTGVGPYELYQSGGTVSFRTRKGGSTLTFASAASITSNTWANVVATWDGTTKYIYINGVRDTNSQTQTPPLDTSTGELAIGAYANANYAFSGSINDVRLYNAALSSSDVMQYYNYSKGRYGL